MSREDKLVREAEKMIKKGKRPSIKHLSEKLDWPPQDVHRVANNLEKKGEIESYTKEFSGRKNRLLALKR